MRWLVVAAVVGLGCSGSTENRPDELDVTHEESIDVGGGPNLTPVPDNAFDAPGTDGLTQDVKTSLDNEDIDENEVKSVKLTLLRLEVTAPIRNGMPAQDLRFLDSLVMKFAAPGQPDVVVAESLPAPSGSTQSASFGMGVYSVEIPVKDVELKPYVTAESLDVTTTVTANGRPAFSCTVKVTTNLHVQVDVVGAARSRGPFGM